MISSSSSGEGYECFSFSCTNPWNLWWDTEKIGRSQLHTHGACGVGGRHRTTCADAIPLTRIKLSPVIMSFPDRETIGVEPARTPCEGGEEGGKGKRESGCPLVALGDRRSWSVAYLHHFEEIGRRLLSGGRWWYDRRSCRHLRLSASGPSLEGVTWVPAIHHTAVAAEKRLA